jgi:hypothetical protein
MLTSDCRLPGGFHRGAFWSLMAMLVSCTVLTRFDPENQPCDMAASTESERCTDGFVCVDGKCKRGELGPAPDASVDIFDAGETPDEDAGHSTVDAGKPRDGGVRKDAGNTGGDR